MTAYSIEHIHSKLDKQIRLVSSYTEIKSLDFIIRSCRLRPNKFSLKKNFLVLEKWWRDEFQNSLIINKSPSIIFNDLRLKPTVITDLYFGLSINNVTKISKLLCLIIGKDTENIQYFLVSFLGLDNHFRTYLIIDGECQPISPLTMGLELLEIIDNHKGMTSYIKIDNLKHSIISCESEEVWLSYLPANGKFIELIKENYNLLAPIFEGV